MLCLRNGICLHSLLRPLLFLDDSHPQHQNINSTERLAFLRQDYLKIQAALLLSVSEYRKMNRIERCQKKGHALFPQMSRKSMALASLFFFNFCVEWLLSSCHVMSLNYTKKAQDFTRLFAFGFLKRLDLQFFAKFPFPFIVTYCLQLSKK